MLKPDGSLFLPFPVMAPLHKLKTYLGLYPLLDSAASINQFYEFMLDVREVGKEVEKVGFKLVHTERYDALKGLKDEISWGKEPLQKLYKSRHPATRDIRLVFTFLCARLTGHMALLVFKKV